MQEGDGTQLQAMISLDRVGQEALDAWKTEVDLGDIVFVHGEVISSRRGNCLCWPIPGKWHRRPFGPYRSRTRR
ncbi:hypothetical protein MPOR_00080 [Mycolicibacterium poriferae]|uniref:Uncharacterized protein n=1 Tax=Mycolicibacterium poriferae TaxID=39694 RepID=A0A6N4V0B7_9MYCO|nr:hypothetical protein MPOR_00080 [Mycolicibacterium poriferae]